MVTKGAWDWAFILYTGMNWLGYSEQEVWQLSPRKWAALTSMHVKLFKQKWGVEDKADAPEAYIDQIAW